MSVSKLNSALTTFKEETQNYDLKNIIDQAASMDPSKAREFRLLLNDSLDDYAALQELQKTVAEFAQVINQQMTTRQSVLNQACRVLSQAEGNSGYSDLIPSFSNYYLERELAKPRPKKFDNGNKEETARLIQEKTQFTIRVVTDITPISQ